MYSKNIDLWTMNIMCCWLQVLFMLGLQKNCFLNLHQHITQAQILSEKYTQNLET